MDDVTPERWLPVVGYEGLYEVSDLGRVRSILRRQRDGYSKPFIRIMKLRLQNVPKRPDNRYWMVELTSNGKRRHRRVHQLVMLAFVGPYPPGMETRHLDGDRANNALSNLKYGTPSENSQDRLRHGRHEQANK